MTSVIFQLRKQLRPPFANWRERQTVAASFRQLAHDKGCCCCVTRLSYGMSHLKEADASCVAGWLAGWLALLGGCLVGRLAGCLVGRLAGWLAGW